MSALTICKWNDNVEVLDVLIYYKRLLRLEEFQVLLVVLWRIWFRRNAFLHGSRVGKDEELLQWCQSYLSEVFSATVKVLPAAVSRCASWLSPTVEWFKLNTDAALMSSKKTAFLGVVVRDSLGFVLLVAVKPVVGDF
ncbi:hypothetical protein ACOSQ3_024392 [Xanthoceras sorbifolium]